MTQRAIPAWNILFIPIWVLLWQFGHFRWEDWWTGCKLWVHAWVHSMRLLSWHWPRGQPWQVRQINNKGWTSTQGRQYVVETCGSWPRMVWKVKSNSFQWWQNKWFWRVSVIPELQNCCFTIVTTSINYFVCELTKQNPVPSVSRSRSWHWHLLLKGNIWYTTVMCEYTALSHWVKLFPHLNIRSKARLAREFCTFV